MKVYQSSKSKRLNAIFALTFALIVGATIPAFLQEINNGFYVIVCINMVTLLLLISILVKTVYKLDDTFLYWQTGPFFGKIEIKTIRKIEHHNGIFVPTFWKPALNKIGLIITYNKFDDIYISPKDEADFIATLLQVNPKIVID